jgi:hypothetical protein
MDAYGTPAFYEGRELRDHIEVLEVVRHEDTGSRLLMEVRFAFRGPISPAVQRFIDRNKMSWITHNEIRPDEARAEWRVLPDHYPDRLKASGVYTFEPDNGGATSVVGLEGELKVHVPVLGKSVERVIVSGLCKYFEAEVLTIPDLQT